MFGRSEWISICSLAAWLMEDETWGFSNLVEAFLCEHPVCSMVMGLENQMCLKAL